ncbi:DinB family protein [Nonlabens antarcticus]|uniref:DinB family protein n=1 Tax=Nonlabens antarcticus TaxID=392714 RepID=UPI001890D4EC|nr:DinB family protein [Nonlabens antarcticus]
MVFRRDLRPAEYAAYYEPYLNLLKQESEMMSTFQDSLDSILERVESIQKPFDYRYEANKWSIGQLLQHCLDTERVFAYRALSFMRGDTAALPGFDQDIYSTGLRDFAFAKANLITSIQVVRASTIDLFANAAPENLDKLGVASENIMSVRAIPFVICGHWKHHLNILHERY